MASWTTGQNRFQIVGPSEKTSTRPEMPVMAKIAATIAPTAVSRAPCPGMPVSVFFCAGCSTLWIGWGLRRSCWTSLTAFLISRLPPILGRMSSQLAMKTPTPSGVSGVQNKTKAITFHRRLLRFFRSCKSLKFMTYLLTGLHSLSFLILPQKTPSVKQMFRKRAKFFFPLLSAPGLTLYRNDGKLYTITRASALRNPNTISLEVMQHG